MFALSSSAQTRSSNKRTFGNSRIAQSASSTTYSMTTGTLPDSETLSLLSRQRQSKKDEVIRKKIEHELSRKKRQRGATRDTSGTRQQQQLRQHKRIAGTVSALKPELALTVKETMLVMEAAQLMAAKRSDCILVVDDKEHLCGIFTAKDLAYRVIASHVDARSTTIASIMTRGPMCVTSDMPAHDALQLMATRGFRHLPVCNEDADIFGLLGVGKCVYDVLGKMERAYESSQKLYDALESVECEWPANGSPSNFAHHMEALRYRMSCPDLTMVMEDDHRVAPPVQVSVKAQVREVARMMKAYRTTAALIMDHGEVVGIFTTKDIVLRVIAAGLNPDNCSIVRVMTPHPDTVTPSTSILDALRKMHNGGYLNLPVLDENRNVIDMVDVLRLARVALSQINDIKGSGTGDINPTGTKWFWSTIAAMSNSASADHDALLISETSSVRTFEPPPTPQLAESLKPVAFQHGLFYPLSSSADPMASPLTSSSGDDALSVISSLQPQTPVPTQLHSTAINTFSFKFSDGCKTYRFRCSYTDFAALEERVRQKFAGASNTGSLTLAYRDDEDDLVDITCNEDLLDAVEIARRAGENLVRLIVNENEDDLLKDLPSEESVDPDEIATVDDQVVITENAAQQHDDPECEYQASLNWPLPSSQNNECAAVTAVAQCSESIALASDCIADEDLKNTWITDRMVLPTTVTFLGMAILGAIIL